MIWDWDEKLNSYSYALDHDQGSDGIVEPEDHDVNDDIMRRKETSIVESSLPVEQSRLERSRSPLLHRADSSDSLDNICPGERRGSSSTTLRMRTGSRSTEPDRQQRSSFGSIDSDGVGKEDELLDPNYKRKFGIACTVTKPPVHVFEEEEELSSELERKWMREFYEREGWLPSPRPSRATLENRKRTM